MKTTSRSKLLLLIIGPAILLAFGCGTHHAKRSQQDIHLTFHNKGPGIMHQAVFVTHVFSYNVGDLKPNEKKEISIKPSYKTKFRQVRTDYMDSEKRETSVIFGLYMGAQNYGALVVEFENGRVAKVIDNTRRTDDK